MPGNQMKEYRQFIQKMLEKEKTRPPHVKGRAASEHTLSRSVADFSSARILA
tara:strand:+ start:196579 stop:196734 length:156 start_codon:yes stop_codon:yes gene_type:complete